MYLILIPLLIFSISLFSKNINKTVNFSSQQNKSIDLSFKINDNNFRELGVIEIIDENSSPANISYLEYDEVLAKSYNLKITKLPNNGQIEFFNSSMTSEKWSSFFQTVHFIAPKLTSSLADTLILQVPKMYKHNRQVSWHSGKLICEAKGMRIPTKLEFQKVAIPDGEYWTNQESDNSAYFFRPPNYTLETSKINVKILYCIGDEFTIQKKHIPEVYTHNDQQERWNYGKKICKDKGMKLPTIDELKSIPNLNGEYLTSEEINSTWTYMFRIPENWSQEMQKHNYKKLVCVRKMNLQSQSFKVIFTIKKVKDFIDKDLKIGALPTKPETFESLQTTFKKWKHSEVTKTAYKGNNKAVLTVVNSAKINKGIGKGFFVKTYKNTPFLAFHVSTGLGVNRGQILWRESGSIADKIIFEFEKPLTDVIVGFTGLGSRFIHSAKAVYEFYYKGKLVRSRGKLDRSQDFDGDGFVATNITTTNVPIDKMIFTIEIDGKNKNNANYSLRYIVGDYLDSEIITAVYNIFISSNAQDEDDELEDDNLTLADSKSYSFNIMDINKPRNIMTKISGQSFQLDLYSYEKNSSNLQDLNGTVKLRFINSDIPNQTVIFNNESKKVISVQAVGSSKNIGVEIIYNNNSSFSEDNFSIRPAGFEINTSENVISGNNFLFKVTAVDSQNHTITNYNEKIDIKYQEKKSQCLTGSLNIADIQFSNGNFSQNLNYSEIGEVNFLLKEKTGQEFAKIDKNDGSGNTRFIPTSSTDITFKYADIKVNSELADFESDYTYISNNLNVSSAKLDNQIIIYNSRNSIVKNYSKNCYSEDYSLVTYFDINTTNTDLILLSDDNSQLVQSPLYILDEVSKDSFYLGTFTKTSRINFKRITNKPLNPIYLKLSDNNLSQIAHFYFARFKIDNYVTSDTSVNIDYYHLIYSSIKPANNIVFGDVVKDSIYQNDIWYKHNNINASRYNISLETQLLNIQDKNISLINFDDSAYMEYNVKVQAPKYILYSSCCDYNMTETFFTIEFIKDSIQDIEDNIDNSVNNDNAQNISDMNSTIRKPDNRINFNYRTTW